MPSLALTPTTFSCSYCCLLHLKENGLQTTNLSFCRVQDVCLANHMLLQETNTKPEDEPSSPTQYRKEFPSLCEIARHQYYLKLAAGEPSVSISGPAELSSVRTASLVKALVDNSHPGNVQHLHWILDSEEEAHLAADQSPSHVVQAAPVLRLAAMALPSKAVERIIKKRGGRSALEWTTLYDVQVDSGEVITWLRSTSQASKMKSYSVQTTTCL